MPNFSQKSFSKSRSDSPPSSDKDSIESGPKKWNYKFWVKVTVFTVIIISQICLFAYIFVKAENGVLKLDDSKLKYNILSI